MNAPLTALAGSLDPAAISQARAAAGATRRRVVDVLEEQLGLDPDAFTARLAATLRLGCLKMEELRRAAPAFDLLPFNECSQHGCALLRPEDGCLLLVTDDPFSAELQSWAEERIREPFSWCLVHRGDLLAYLAGHEETLRALDAVQAETGAHIEERESVENLSLKAISDESSE
ncbi:MAG: type II/IV secretion system protein, partial [Burkholderiales bacterium]